MSKSLQYIRQNKDIYYPIIINSAICYTLAYIFIYFFYQLATFIASIGSGINVAIGYNGIKFITGDYSPLWNKDSLFAVFLSGSIITLFFGIVALLLYIVIMYSKLTLKIFLLWVFLHAFNRIISTFVLGNIFFLYGPNLILDWIYLGNEFKILLSAFLLLLLLIIGMFSSNAFLHSTDSVHLIKKKNRLSFLLSQVLIPYLIGNIAIVVFFLPKLPFIELAINLCMIIVISPIFFHYKNFSVLEIDEPVMKFNINRRFLFILIISVVVLRLLFIKSYIF